MQTTFTPEQLKDPAIRRSNEVLRTCVHCGFLHCHLPDLPGARGRARQSAWADISYKKICLENGRPADEKTVKHIDRCLSLPRLHDDLPFGRALHASRGPRAGVYRADLSPPAFRAAAALDAGADPALSDALPGRATGRQDRPALRLSDAGCAAEGDAGHGPEADPAGQPATTTRRSFRPRANARCAWR